MATQLILLWLACGGMSEAERYTTVLAMNPVDPERALALCEGIRDPNAQAECAMHAASRGAVDSGMDPEALCERVPEGTWRAECYFRAAEAYSERKQDPKAAAMCARTQIFADDCGQHLWQDALQGIIAPHGPGGFATQLPRAEGVYRRWLAMLGDSTDIRDRFWRRYYQNGFETLDLVDLAPCEAVRGQGRAVEDHAERCRHAGAHLLQRRVRRIVVIPELRAAFCALPDATCASASSMRQIACAPDPLLDAVLSEQREWVCVQGHNEPAPESALIHYLRPAPP